MDAYGDYDDDAGDASSEALAEGNSFLPGLSPRLGAGGGVGADVLNAIFFCTMH